MQLFYLKYVFSFLFIWCCYFQNTSAVIPTNDPPVVDGISYVDEEIPERVLIRVGNRHFRRGSYYDALDSFSPVLERDSSNLDIIWKMALSQFYTRNYEGTLYLLALYRLVNEETENPSLYNYYKGESLLRESNYAKASIYLDNFLQSNAARQNPDFHKKAEQSLANCMFAIKHVNDTLSYQVFPLDSGVNAPYTEYAPFVLGDSLLFYSSLNYDSVHREATFGSWTFSSQIYKSMIKESAVMPGQLLPRPVNDPLYHNGHGSFTPDGRRFYYSRCAEMPNNIKICNIYRSVYQNGGWSEPLRLKGEINNPRYTVTDPFVTTGKDGRDILFFVSDMPGGLGGLDIWHVTVERSGETGRPINAGSAVNTADDERSPFADVESGKLYFSSDGHPGFGGFDIFKTNNRWLIWSKVENLGIPFNSALDDLYFTKGEREDVFYIVSNRHGTMTLRGPTCCDDIFRVERKASLYTYVQLNMVNREDNLEIESYQVKVFDWKDNEKDFLITKDISKTDNLLKLDKQKDYYLEIHKQGYMPASMPLFLSGTDLDSLSLDLLLEPLLAGRTYNLDNVYFEYNKFGLNKESKTVLDDLYQILVNNPQLSVELSSHTDDIGGEQFNLELSQKRAESCVNYLVEKGISKERLVPKGYGASNPVAPNRFKDGTDNPEGRQQNRRTEFRVLEKD